MSLGTSLLKPDGMGKRKHKLADDFTSCGISPKRISVTSDCEKRDHLRPSSSELQSAMTPRLRVCSLSIDSSENVSNLLQHCNADVLLISRKKAESVSNWRLDAGPEANLIEISEWLRMALRPRLAVLNHIRFERTFELLGNLANDTLLGETSSQRAVTMAHLRAWAASRAALVQLRDLQSGMELLLCVVDDAGMPATERLPVRVAEVCTLLGEAQSVLRNSGDRNVVLLLAVHSDEHSSVLDEIVESGYPNSDSITHLQSVPMRPDAQTTSRALINTLWPFFQHSVLGFRCISNFGNASFGRLKLWFTATNDDFVRVEPVQNQDSGQIDLVDFTLK